MSHYAFLNECDVSEIEKEAMLDGKLQILPYSFYKEHDINTILVFMHKHGIYVLPTQELIDWLKENIVGSAIEIGAGNGAIGRALGIPITDSKMQDDPAVKAFYKMAGQPTITYPSDIIKMDALEAVTKYKPNTVIGAFITHKFNPITNDGNTLGVAEEFVLLGCDKYINIGNTVTHKNKPILQLKHESFQFDWLITRAVHQALNRIFVFIKPKI